MGSAYDSLVHRSLSRMGSMKVHHQLARGFYEHEPSSLSLGFKRLRPLAPKLHTSTTNTTSSPHHFDLKTFIRPESGPRKIPNSTSTTLLHNHVTNNKDSPSSPHLQVETHPGGTRWNPTQEQIGILEMLYRGGMRTPNAQQIEHITAQLGKYGKIEGKNVFYWFQNHKARERQKQKRNNNNNILLHSNNSPPPPTTTNHNNSSIITTTCMSSSSTSTISTNLTFHTHQEDLHDFNPLRKKKCIRTWEFDECFEQKSPSSSRDTTTTLELFPLHPESK